MPPDVPLSQRGGANIGVIPAFVTRFSTALAELEPVVLGDTLLWESPLEGEVRAVGQVTVYNQSATALTVNVYMIDDAGHEFFIASQPLPAAGVLPPLTNYVQFLTTTNPMILEFGEKLILRTTGPGYAGGAFVETDSALMVGVHSDRVDLTTTLQTVLAPPPGKGFGPAIGPFPIIIGSTDSVPHAVDFYYVRDGISTLIIKGWDVVPNDPRQVPFSSIGCHKELRAVLREPVVTPGAVVRFFCFFIVGDAGVRGSDSDCD